LSKVNVGYIGLGNIGKPSALQLIGDQFNAHVFDVYAPAVQELVDAGAVGCATVAELASSCEQIGICVRDDEQVESLLFGDEGILAHANDGTRVTVHSTVTQARLLEWAAEAEKVGVRLIDAPISGGAHGAAAGTLCYMVGGSDADLAAVTPVFRTSGDSIVHAGPLGAGIALKLCNNFIQYAELVAMAEATRLGESCGLSPEVLREVGKSNGVTSENMYKFIVGRNEYVRNGSPEQGTQYFGAMGALGVKDLECALRSANENGVSMPTAEFLKDRIERVFLGLDESRPLTTGDAQ